MSIKALRRVNLRKIANQLGGISILARQLNKTPAQISHLIGINASKNIGDKLAHNIEQALNLPKNWLDVEHLEEELNAFIDSCLAITNVPLLTGQEIVNWIQKPNRSLLQRKVQYIKTNLKLNKHAFAMEVKNDFMESPRGLSFPCGCIVIADPELPLKNNNYIIICLENINAPFIRQIVQEGSRKYLKPLNPCYPIIELTTQNYMICGILRQVIITL